MQKYTIYCSFFGIDRMANEFFKNSDTRLYNETFGQFAFPQSCIIQPNQVNNQKKYFNFMAVSLKIFFLDEKFSSFHEIYF